MANYTLITADFARQVFRYNPETGRISKFLKCGSASARCPDNQTRNGYRYVEFKKQRIAAHRLAWLLYYGEWPDGILDHINRDKSDNRIANLRVATASENTHNVGLRKDNSSGYSGVNWHKRTNTWQVRIRIAGAHVFIGHFKNLKDAVEARIAHEKLHHPTKT